jgi:hypothetical protein
MHSGRSPPEPAAYGFSLGHMPLKGGSLWLEAALAIGFWLQTVWLLAANLGLLATNRDEFALPRRAVRVLI